MGDERISAVRFDDSLPAMVDVIARRFGGEIISKSVFIRDATGRLSVTLGEPVEPGFKAEVLEELVAVLGQYCRLDLAIRDINDPTAEVIIAEAADAQPVRCGSHRIRLLDRRIVGADWLRPPAPSASGIPRIVFSSLKGGVGRSTALAVAASYLSARGRRVLAIDLDLEAPGIGTMLLQPKILPDFGTLDYLVENGITGIDDYFLLNCQGQSFLGKNGGQVTVVPAIGRTTIAHPYNALAKISRSYLEDFQDAASLTLLDQIREMVDRIGDPASYDVILIDARAGLHETTSAVILGLGAEVLLFGVDEPQTYLGYRLLLSHLARFEVSEDDDWRARLQFVHAKASHDPKKQKSAEDRFQDLFDIVYDKPAILIPQQSLTEEDFDLNWAADALDEVLTAEEPSPVLRILDDDRYQDFDPLADRDLLTDEAYQVTFGSFLEWLDLVVVDEEPSEPE
jgi:cellulose biosynthesis protein BcsQ